MILGIDPGHSGALALVDKDKKFVACWDMPLLEKGGVDAKALSLMFDTSTIDFAVIEEVSAMAYTQKDGTRRGQGAAASFAFGKSFGVVLGVLSAFKIPVFGVRPAIWKTLMGLSSDKNKSRALATKLYPTQAARFSRKKDDGRAEAILLAVFGADRFRNRPLEKVGSAF